MPRMQLKLRDPSPLSTVTESRAYKTLSLDSRCAQQLPGYPCGVRRHLQLIRPDKLISHLLATCTVSSSRLKKQDTWMTCRISVGGWSVLRVLSLAVGGLGKAENVDRILRRSAREFQFGVSMSKSKQQRVGATEAFSSKRAPCE